MILSFKNNFIITIKYIKGNKYIYLFFKNLKKLSLVLYLYYYRNTFSILLVHPYTNPVILLFSIYIKPFIAFNKQPNSRSLEC